MLPAFVSFVRRKVFRLRRDRWNHQYAQGLWDGLAQPDELPRFSIVAGYVSFFKPNRPSILEIGCGTGLFFQRLPANSYSRYFGTDISNVAIAEASQHPTATANFLVADMDQFVPNEPVDLIILNEVLYYSRQPIDTLCRLAQSLGPDGLIIVTMNQHDRAQQLWHNLDTAFTTVAETTVSTTKDTWRCRVMK